MKKEWTTPETEELEVGEHEPSNPDGQTDKRS